MVKFLKGKKIYLAGLTKKDCRGRYLEMVNDAEALTFVEGIGYHPLYPFDLERYIKSNDDRSNLLLGIFETRTGAHAGNIHLSRISPHHRHCSYGIVMHRKYMGKGYAYEASKILIKHAFEKMNIHRIEITSVADNKKAAKLYKRLGAIEEGRKREAFYSKGKYSDLVIFSILNKPKIGGGSDAG